MSPRIKLGTTMISSISPPFYISFPSVLVNRELLLYLLRGIDVFGLRGLSNLYAFMIAREFIDVQKRLKAMLTKETANALRTFAESLFPNDTLARNPNVIYDGVLKETKKMWTVLFGMAFFGVFELLLTCFRITLQNRSNSTVEAKYFVNSECIFFLLLLLLFLLFSLFKAYLPFELEFTFVHLGSCQYFPNQRYHRTL